MQEFIEASRSLKGKTTSELSVHNIGYEACSAGYHYSPRVCPYHIIHFVTKGKGTLYIHQLSLPVGTGDAFIIPADKVAAYEASKEDPWNYTWIGFLGTTSASVIRQLLAVSEEKYVVHGLDTKKYAGLIRPAAHMEERNMTNYYFANGLLFQIIAELSKDFQGLAASAMQSDLANEIRYYLEMKYSEKLVLSEVAKNFGIHPNYLTRTFREHFGITPKQFLMQLKLEKSCRLLSETDPPIGLIARTLGFDDQMTFAKTFRKSMFLTPSAYRQQTQKEKSAVLKETVDDYVTYIPLSF